MLRNARTFSSFVPETSPPGIAPLAVVMMSRAPGEWGEDWGAEMGAEVQAATIRYAARRWDAYYATNSLPMSVTVSALAVHRPGLIGAVSPFTGMLHIWGR